MIFRLDVMQRYNLQEVINSWHINTTGVPSDAELQDFITNTHEAWNARQAADLTLLNVNVRRVDVTGAMGRTFVPTGWPKTGGSGAVDGLPGFAAVLLKGISLDGQPPGRLRKFLCGVREDDTDAGVLTSGAMTSWGTIAAALQAWNNTEGETPIVAVRYTTGADPVVDAFNQIEFFSISPNIALQSRRRIGRGR